MSGLMAWLASMKRESSVLGLNAARVVSSKMLGAGAPSSFDRLRMRAAHTLGAEPRAAALASAQHRRSAANSIGSLQGLSNTLMVSLSNHGGSSEKPSDVSAGRFGYRSSPSASWISPAPVALALGVALLVALWFGPLPVLAAGSFAAHMVMHMGVVAIAAPLLAYGISRLVPDQVSKLPASLAMVAALFEFVAVWAWHAPALHDSARIHAGMFVAEQASFLIASVLVWLTAIGVARRDGGRAQLAGVGALLLTSMHMTLLGALLLLAPRPLYACAALCAPAANLTPLGDQQLGGVIMLIVGGLVYLAGGLALLATVLRERSDPLSAGEGAR